MCKLKSRVDTKSKAQPLLQTLPASTGSGDVYFISNQGSGTITVAVTGSDTVNGTTPLTIPASTIAYYVDAEAGNWHSNW